MNELHTVPTLTEMKRIWWKEQTPEVRAQLQVDPWAAKVAFEWRGMIESMIIIKWVQP